MDRLGTIGDYELLAEIGRGGMGAVFRARHRTLGVERALKIAKESSRPEVLERFQREARILARLGGQGILPIHESGVANGCPWVAMPLMRGGSLRSRLDAARTIPWLEAARLVSGLARALERCHSERVIHRDIKPDNVLLDEEGNAYLADFGIAKDLGARSLTQTGTFVGTFLYAAPEQLTGDKIDGRADVYALGAVLYELVTGAPPYQADSIQAHLEAVRSEQLVPASKLAGAPRGLDEIVAKALALEPGRRFQTVAGLARALDELVAKPAAPTRRTAPAIGLLLLGVGGAVFAGTRRRADAPPPLPSSNAPAAAPHVPVPRPVAATAPVSSEAGRAALARARGHVERGALGGVAPPEEIAAIARELETAAKAGTFDSELGRVLASAVSMGEFAEARKVELLRLAYAHDPSSFVRLRLGLALPHGPATRVEVLALFEPFLDARSEEALPERTEALAVAVGLHLYNGGDAATALELAERGFELSPQNSFMTLRLAEAQLLNERWEETLATTDRLLRKPPPPEIELDEIELDAKLSGPYPHRLRAQALGGLGRWKEVIEEIALADEDPTLLFLKARARARLGDLAGARADLEAARKRGGAEPKYIEAAEEEVRKLSK